jgi:hypothetical protein
MKCDGFEAVINDLAKGVIMDAALRDQALSHAASCQGCAMRLADERELTAGLKALAIASVVETPARVEASLIAVFREQHAALGKRGPGPVESRRATHRWLFAAGGVAAAVAIVLLLSLAISRTRDAAERQKAEQAIATPSVPDQHQEPALKPHDSQKEPEQKKPVVNAAPTIAAVSGRVRKTPGTKPGTKHGPELRDDSNTEAEIATDFFPLMNRGAGQLDSGQIVRVELPRSALMSFGLPMNMDRAGERIKADVVFGNDGLARAIRFVR